MRLPVIIAALLALSSCADACTAVGGGALRQSALHGGAAVQGPSMSPPVDDAVVGVDWTIPPVFEYAAYLESGADNDPIETPRCRGTLCSTLALTQGTLANRPTLRTACPVGATTKPCYRVDGGDWVRDTVVRTGLRFLHDGNGATCLWLLETSLTAQQGVMHTGDTGGGAPGFNAYYFNGTSYGFWQTAASGATINTGASSTPINQMHALMTIDLVADTPDMAIFAQDFTTAITTASLGSRAATDSLTPLTWGGDWTGGSHVTGYIPLIACWSQRLTTAQREAEQVNLEAYFGGAFPR